MQTLKINTLETVLDRQKRQLPTAVWRNGGCSASYDSFVVGSSAVLRLNFCAKNPPLRQAPKRYGHFEKKIKHKITNPCNRKIIKTALEKLILKNSDVLDSH